jgi:hypothetical protein
MDGNVIAVKTSVRRALRNRAALTGLRAALRRGHGQNHRLELLRATRDLTAEEATRLAAWPLERAHLRRDLERMSREFAAVPPVDTPPAQDV